MLEGCTVQHSASTVHQDPSLYIVASKLAPTNDQHQTPFLAFQHGFVSSRRSRSFTRRSVCVRGFTFERRIVGLQHLNTFALGCFEIWLRLQEVIRELTADLAMDMKQLAQTNLSVLQYLNLASATNSLNNFQSPMR